MTPYRPANGTEGIDFMERFCFQCRRETWNPETDEGEKCDILTRAQLYPAWPAAPADGHEYPTEWVEDAEGRGTCTAFEDEAIPLPVPVDPRQGVLFEAAPGRPDVG